MSGIPDSPQNTSPEQMQQLIIRQKLDRSIETVRELLTYTGHKRQVPESYFAMVLLPIIRDWYRGIPNPQHGLWLNVADGQYNQIEVVDDDTGEVVYIAPSAYIEIPPIVIRRQPNESYKLTLADVVDRQAIALENGETRKVMQIEAAIQGFHHFQRSANNTLVNILLLVEIYKRYEFDLKELFGDEVDRVLVSLYPDEHSIESESTEIVPPEEEYTTYDY